MNTARTIRPRARSGFAWPILITVFAAAPSAFAQSASPEDIASARVLGVDGSRLADAGDCKNAVPKLEGAEKLYHAPTTLDRLGECQIALGQLVAGTESLNRVVREPLAASAPAAFVAAKKRAQTALETALPRIGSLKIHVDGAPLDKITVTVDGDKVAAALFDSDRPTDPGVREVAAAAPGFKTATATVVVHDGAESTIALRLDPDPNAVIAPSVATNAPLAAPPMSDATIAHPPASKGPPLAAAFVAFGVGGVGLAVGTIFGIVALNSKSTLDGACVQKSCPASSQSDIDSLGTKATISTIGFGVGIAGVAAGAILLAVSHPNEGATATAAPVAPRVSPWIGLGAAGVGGTFQ